MERILTLSHKNGDYVAVNVSGPTTVRTELQDTLKDAAAYLNRPSTTKNVALQLTDAVLARDEYVEILEWISAIQRSVYRLAIVGTTRRQQRPLKRGIRQLSTAVNSRFFEDWEAAKDWLVGAIR